MNAQEEEEEEEEDPLLGKEEDTMDISPLSVSRQEFHNLTLHSPPSLVLQRNRSRTRTSRFSPTQIFNFHNLTLDSPKSEVSSDPQRHRERGCKRSRSNPSMSWHFGHAEESSFKSRVKKIPEHLGPFFMKSMIRSNISVCFMLTMPRRFCKLHLPSRGTATVTLKDKEGKEFETNFLAEKRTLSGGWKGFCQAKHLRLDDVLVFQLVSPLKFKVHISRPEYVLSEEDIDAAFVLLKMSASEQRLFEENLLMSPPRDFFHGNIGETRPQIPDINVALVDDDEELVSRMADSFHGNIGETFHGNIGETRCQIPDINVALVDDDDEFENRMADQEIGSFSRSGRFNPARHSF